MAGIDADPRLAFIVEAAAEGLEVDRAAVRALVRAESERMRCFFDGGAWFLVQLWP